MTKAQIIAVAMRHEVPVEFCREGQSKERLLQSVLGWHSLMAGHASILGDNDTLNACRDKQARLEAELAAVNIKPL